MSWIRILIIEKLDKVVEPSRYNSSHHRTEPVNPVIAWKIRRNHARAKGARRVHRCAGIIYASYVNDEKREADADGCDEGVFGLFGREHENCEH